jgi:hypothetical protein
LGLSRQAKKVPVFRYFSPDIANQINFTKRKAIQVSKLKKKLNLLCCENLKTSCLCDVTKVQTLSYFNAASMRDASAISVGSDKALT